MKNIVLSCFLLFGFTNVYSQDNYVPANPQILPKFTGDIKKYIAQHIVYPRDAEMQEIEGIVYVSFVVEKDGSISQVKIVKGITSSLDSAAVHLAAQMPKWSPAMDHGQAIRCKSDLAIHFILPKKQTPKTKE